MVSVLDEVSQALSTETLRQLNADVAGGMSPEVVAEAWLAAERSAMTTEMQPESGTRSTPGADQWANRRYRRRSGRGAGAGGRRARRPRCRGISGEAASEWLVALGLLLAWMIVIYTLRLGTST